MNYFGKYGNEIFKSSDAVPVFIVDDDSAYSYSLGFHLKKDTSYKIYCYSTGEECFKNLYLNPSIVILDYYLNTKNPNATNGLDALKKIKKMSPKTHVIMLSAQDALQVAVSSLSLGAYTYIIKDEHAHSSIMKIVNALSKEHLKQV